MAGVPDEPAVVYTMRELFERIDERLVRMDEKLNEKASTADVAALGVRVDRLESTKDRAWGVVLGLSISLRSALQRALAAFRALSLRSSLVMFLALTTPPRARPEDSTTESSGDACSVMRASCHKARDMQASIGACVHRSHQVDHHDLQRLSADGRPTCRAGGGSLGAGWSESSGSCPAAGVGG
jgi:hypothetical protein